MIWACDIATPWGNLGKRGGMPGTIFRKAQNEIDADYLQKAI